MDFISLIILQNDLNEYLTNFEHESRMRIIWQSHEKSYKNHMKIILLFAVISGMMIKCYCHTMFFERVPLNNTLKYHT